VVHPKNPFVENFCKL